MYVFSMTLSYTPKLRLDDRYQHWQSRNELAQRADQATLHQRFDTLETNHTSLARTLSMFKSRRMSSFCLQIPLSDQQHSSIIAMIVSLKWLLNNTSDRAREHQFLSHSIRFLTTSSGQHIELENWMVTSFEVEFGPKIGSGSLYVHLR